MFRWLRSETVGRFRVFGGGAKGCEDCDILDDVGGFFVKEPLLFLGEADAFAVEILELVDLFDRGSCNKFKLRVCRSRMNESN